MTKHTAFLPALLLVLCQGACTQLLPEAKSVRMTQHARTVDHCQFIGQKTVNSLWTGTGELHGRTEVETKLRNATAKLGGDTVLVQHRGRSMYDQRLTGDVYRCHRGSRLATNQPPRR